MSILILYGEDNLGLDKYFLEVRKKYHKVVYFEQPPEFFELQEKVLSQEFFPESTIYVFKSYFKGNISRDKFSNKIELISKFLLEQEKNYDFVLMEEDKNKLKYYKKKFPKADYKEFKLPAYLFNFLDNLRPKNFKNCFVYFKKTTQKTAVELVVYMLKRRIRELILLSQGDLKGNYQSWQIGKLKKQVQTWKLEKLLQFYQALFRLEKSIKTGSTPLNIEKSIELLLSLYL